jgi:hypothetical protein
MFFAENVFVFEGLRGDTRGYLGGVRRSSKFTLCLLGISQCMLGSAAGRR